MNILSSVNEDCMPCKSETSRRTISARLTNRREELEKQLEQVNNAIAAFEKHPEVAAVFDSIARLNF